MSQSPLGESENPPVLVLSSLRESHPFQERRIILNEVIKVGRSVARLKPAPNNAIFDCKVLSRSHALIWHKDGKFWLRDTNSSNGTFVNNTRVHKKAGEDFSDREIFSGDTIRFGVDVVERDTTHGCIISQVTIYLGNGCEAKPNLDQTGVINGMVGASAFHSEQVFLLFHLANEALFREQSLVDKLDDLKRLVSDIQEISETGWQAMLREDRLLEKLALYESQLSMLKEDLPQDSLQNHLCQALEDKMSLEKASKIMLARILEEKTEAMTKASDLENSLADSERECARLREVCENTQEAYRTIADEFQTKVKELEHLEQQLKNVTTEKEDLESQLKDQELSTLDQLKINLLREFKNTDLTSPAVSCDTSTPLTCGKPDQPNQSDYVSSQLDDNAISEDAFSSALDRARQLAARLALSQARAELTLDKYFAQQNQQKAPNVCHTSGDVCASVPSKTDENDKNYDNANEIVMEPKTSLLTNSIPPTDSQSTEISRSSKPESSVNENEVIQMRRELNNRDVCASVPSKTDENDKNYDNANELVMEPKTSLLTNSIPPTDSQSTEISRSSKPESSVNENEVIQMRRELNNRSILDISKFCCI
ncbi:Sarcolemmal membrane-associated protein [Fasciolopsis buskii]|uniref:Sarcolemmal membrane-associated protein n=1 Tax=Fasciolopsis buskii TaxID=27845 RepID=A0A8E0VL64_9TREM|nr:Sarcolemmal membrane-associated protein [Fasciolopsis buski]